MVARQQPLVPATFYLSPRAYGITIFSPRQTMSPRNPQRQGSVYPTIRKSPIAIQADDHLAGRTERAVRFNQTATNLQGADYRLPGSRTRLENGASRRRDRCTPVHSSPPRFSVSHRVHPPPEPKNILRRKAMHGVPMTSVLVITSR